MSAGICKDCGVDIIWGRTAAGKHQPLDPARLDRTDTRANLAAYRDHLGVVRVRVLPDGEQPDSHEWRAMPHFATCITRLVQAGKVDDVIPLARRRRGRAL